MEEGGIQTRRQARNWVFTIPLTGGRAWNCPGPAVLDMYHVRGMVYQWEVGEVSGMKHVQGYIEFNRPKRMNQVKTALACDWAHLEMRRGTKLEAILYASKDETREPGPWHVFIGQGVETIPWGFK